jgi:hypothetical protein
MAAAALVMIALCIVVRQPKFCFIYAGLLLYLAWAFKQSVILAFLGLCLWLLLNKRWRDLVLLAAVYGALVAATLLIGSPEYRFSILIAPQMVRGFAFSLPWILRALGAGLTALALNLYWVAAPFVLVIKPCAPSIPRLFEEKTRNGWVSLLTTVFTLALILGLAAMGKIGGTSNYLFEAFAAGSTLLQIAVFTLPGRLVTALLLFGCIQPAVQLVGVAIGYHHPGKKDMVPIATASEYRDALALRNRLAGLKKPLFTTDGVFALPWNSTDYGAPAVVLDPNFQQAARSREVNGGIEGMLQRGEFPTVMLASTDLVYLRSLNPGYRKVAESRQQGVTYTIYVIGAETPTLNHP